MLQILKLTIYAAFLLFPLTVSGQVPNSQSVLHEGNNYWVVWSYENQKGETIAPDSACAAIYDEKTGTQEDLVCSADPDDIQRFDFDLGGSQIVDNDNEYESKLSVTVWQFPEGSPTMTGSKVERFWVVNNRGIVVQESSPGSDVWTVVFQ